MHAKLYIHFVESGVNSALSGSSVHCLHSSNLKLTKNVSYFGGEMFLLLS